MSIQLGWHMLKPIDLKVNYTKPEYAVADTEFPVFTWGCENLSEDECYQNGYRIIVFYNNEILWDSGYSKDLNMRCVYSGKALPSGAIVEWKLQLTDNMGNVTKFVYSYFKTVCFDALCGEWIKTSFDCHNSVVNFKKEFELSQMPERAVMYYCGLGLSKPYINGLETDNYRLQPAFTNYKKQAQYVTIPLDVSMFKCGLNEVRIAVAGGWRKNYGKYLENMSSNRSIEFMGDICLWAMLVLYNKSGRRKIYSTDLSWSCAVGNITYSHLFNGEVFDETAQRNKWEKVCISDFSPNTLVPQCIEPVCVKREIKPVCSYLKNGIRIYDFGENLAGVVHLRAKGFGKNVCFIMHHAEEINDSGELFTDTLRSAEAMDKYICIDGECNVDFTPMFTYHGFRFVSLEIQGDFEGEIDLTALSFYTDIDTDSHFYCGNQIMNEIYRAALRTERCNIHSIASDCPQRDERMAWMNDATVRFMSMPYNFNIPRLFEKIADDISNEQSDDGALTCTAPFVFGERPADPVCSAYLIAVYEYYKFTGDDRLIRKHYDSMANWNRCLKSYTHNGIVNYSYYGDWAGPADCCYSTATIGNSDVLKTEEYDPGAANSMYLSGEMISTAVYYMNLTLMEVFAQIISKDATEFTVEKERVQRAYIEKWFDAETVSIGNNSQGECAISLYVGILPKEYENEIAKKMAMAVTNSGTRITTGNITTPILFDMLTKYGYTDIAWSLITSTTYPSIGYMIENGATTIWERFELKKESGMNSHNHPMYGAMIGWLYRSMAGFKVIEPAKNYVLKPCIPEDLKYFEMKIPILAGSIYIKYENKYGMEVLFVNIPAGIKVTVDFRGKEKEMDVGFNRIQCSVTHR